MKNIVNTTILFRFALLHPLKQKYSKAVKTIASINNEEDKVFRIVPKAYSNKLLIINVEKQLIMANDSVFNAVVLSAYKRTVIDDVITVASNTGSVNPKKKLITSNIKLI